MSKTKNVVSLPTKPNGDQPWKCQVCGAEMSYAQPINFQKQLTLLKNFMDEHKHEAAA